MNIALAGAGGTGKGTLGKALAYTLKAVFLPSHIKDTGLMLNMMNSYKDEIGKEQELVFQHAIMFGQLYQERALQIAGLDYIAERTTLDYIPYYLVRGLSPDAPYVTAAREWAKHNYDFVVYLPVEFEPQDKEENSWKERESAEQERTSSIILEELTALNIPTITVTGSVTDRLHQVLSFKAKLVTK